MREPCFLCGKEAATREGTAAYYRFYNEQCERWKSEAICTTCLTKLNGKREQFVVKGGTR